MNSNRLEYLNELADDYGIPLFDVCSLADMLGENEDYDGLIVALEDYHDFVEV
jgi:hypothetical protein